MKIWVQLDINKPKSKMVYIDPCPKCGRKGLLKLVKKKKKYYFRIYHWILYKFEVDLTVRQRNDICKVTIHEEELFFKLLDEYSKVTKVKPEVFEWLKIWV